MSESPTFIRALLLQGFRAYLEPRTFDFAKQRCLAVFAPNGYGKSSLIDSLEFLFSDTGTLRRLGTKAIHNNAGPTALVHELAAEKKIAPSVAIEFMCGGVSTSGSRSAMGAKRERPPEISNVCARFAVDPIIRGYEMRSFVEVETAEQRYTSVVNWLQLGPLVDAQKNLRALRQQAKAVAEDPAAFNRIDAQLAKETAQLVKTWTVDAVVDHVNTVVLKPLDDSLALKSIDTSDAAHQVVVARALAEEKRLGLEGLRQIRNALGSLYDTTVDPITGEPLPSGAIPAFTDAVSAKAATAANLETERAAAAEAAFSALWKEAEPLFAADATPLNDCPLCLTAIGDTKAGTRDGVREHLASHLAALKG